MILSCRRMRRTLAASHVPNPENPEAMKPVHPSPCAVLLWAAGLLPASLHAGSITAHPADAQFTTNTSGSSVIVGPSGASANRIFIGGEYYSRSLTHYVAPFQLPDLGPGTFSNVGITVTTEGGLGGGDAASPIPVNLFVLPGARPFTPVLATDVNAAGVNHTQLGTLVKAGFLNASTVPGSSVGTGADESAALSAWLNQSYADGANAGDVVFMRLSPAGLAASDVPYYGSENGFTVDAGFVVQANNGGSAGPVLTYTFTPQAEAAPEINGFSSNRGAVGLGGSATLVERHRSHLAHARSRRHQRHRAFVADGDAVVDHGLHAHRGECLGHAHQCAVDADGAVDLGARQLECECRIGQQFDFGGQACRHCTR